MSSVWVILGIIENECFHMKIEDVIKKRRMMSKECNWRSVHNSNF